MIGKGFVRLAIVMMIAMTLFSGMNCLGGTSAGKVPGYKVGDQWVYTHIYSDESYTMTIEVTDKSTLDGEPCYILDCSFVPDLYELYDSMRFWASTSEPYFYPMKSELEADIQGEDYSFTTEHSVEYPDGDPWPLEVGKEFSAIETITITTVISGETETETETETVVYKVEDKEEVTVAAGEFTCFKIKQYSEDDELLRTWWYSDDVKSDVKSLDSVAGENSELQSYSLG